MAEQAPVLTVLVFSAIAAGVAPAGVAPFAFRDQVPLNWLGWAYALASGLMLGAGYLVMEEGLRSGFPAVLGAGLGVAYTYWTHLYTGTDGIDTRPGVRVSLRYGYKVILLNTMHSASEGVAIGVAMAVNLKLGAFVALALAIHNVAEAMALTAVLRVRDMSLGEAAGLCLVTNAPQVLLAIVAFSLVPALPATLPWALGFAAGALVYLVMTELLPTSYERAENLGIAFIVSIGTGLVVLLKGFIV